MSQPNNPCVVASAIVNSHCSDIIPQTYAIAISEDGNLYINHKLYGKVTCVEKDTITVCLISNNQFLNGQIVQITVFLSENQTINDAIKNSCL